MYPLPSSQPPLDCSLLMLLMTPKVIKATEPKIWQDIRENTVCVYFRTRVASIHRVAEKAHSRKLVVASPATNIPFIALRALALRAPAAFWRDIVTPAARVYYEELQVVAAEFAGELVLCRDART